MIRKTNRRGIEYHEAEKQHLKLEDLRNTRVINRYLYKVNIPAYPQPEFHVCRLKHDTDGWGLHGIKRDEGFKNPDQDGLLWWSLDVGPEEITSAERRLLETTYPDQTEEQAQRQQSFLGTFATSPAFKRTSRLGSYRFTFDLEEVLKAYSEQVLNFDAGRLRENLKFCCAEKVGLIRGVEFEEFSEAEEAVQRLWPDNPSPLEKEEDPK
ncbi:uncharacterized protein [Cebidichthys violaceus]|uniref:uncharacterized protein isoform X2 n=1 Tax=Cebidichthys violaceus TaxID=271503 RepID=UPI0035CC6B1B